ncbi:PaaX family transcriptional regulator C-terminal domain-containing protein [Kitasatospora sp. NPDC101183]|uniref:PaaX family transcriptional regulator C-terminal domain-containing protein n=1 Tax=Kitasatospora sp. NPDC101183 TaxID=3364100 RepID=UPI00380AF195
MQEIPTRVLVDALVRADDTVDCGELYAVAGRLGMSDQQVRLTIKRLTADGRFVQEGRGRRAVLRSTSTARRSFEPDVEHLTLMYSQDAGLAPWDGLWHLVGFAVPERDRLARASLREALLRLGGAPVQAGLYVSPHPWERDVRREAGALELLDHLTFLTTRDLRTGYVDHPLNLARHWWPLKEVAEGYERLADLATDRLAQLAEGGLGETELLTVAIELAAAFTEATEPDPLLPPELLPPSWPGVHARDLVARCWSLLLADRQPGEPMLFSAYAGVVALITSTPD